MLRAFILTFVFTAVFTFLNSCGDAINFYREFKYYKRMDLWHYLKFGWMFCAVGAGWCLNDLMRAMEYNVFGCVFVLLFFAVIRWVFHETYMKMWRTP